MFYEKSIKLFVTSIIVCYIYTICQLNIALTISYYYKTLLSITRDACVRHPIPLHVFRMFCILNDFFYRLFFYI